MSRKFCRRSEKGICANKDILLVGTELRTSVDYTREHGMEGSTHDDGDLGDFSQQSYQPTCLFARLLCCAKELHSWAMRPFARLAGRRKSCAIW
jgi:hypothetical protein